MKTKVLTVLVFLLAYVGAAWADVGRYTQSLDGGGWHLWFDKEAQWRNDRLYLPGEVTDLSKLPVNPPTGGWQRLNGNNDAKSVSVPGTVEEYLTVSDAPRPEHSEGVSWWWRTLEVPSAEAGRRFLLFFEAVRMRAEVYLDGQLVAYDIIGETPFHADITKYVKPGHRQTLAVRITNPGGNFHWQDFTAQRWGDYLIPPGRGFSGIIGRVKLVGVDDVHISDLYMQNTPTPTTANAIVTVDNASGKAQKKDILVTVREKADGGKTVFTKRLKGVEIPAGGKAVTVRIDVPDAKLWDISSPNLYVCDAKLTKGKRTLDAESRTFGFRWFTAEGIGSDAVLRLNGRRMMLRSAISWGYFPVTGLGATEEMAETQVRAAQSMGLNMLNFHRCMGSPIVLDKADELGLLYYEEPGSFHSAGHDPFIRAIVNEKLRRMVYRDRSHPSLIIYNLINEFGGAFSRDKALVAKRMDDMRKAHAIDPSRIMTFTSGWAGKEWAEEDSKAHMMPFDSTLYMRGWYDNHRAGGPATWEEGYYKGPKDNLMYTSNRREIYMRGEEGAISTPPRLELINAKLSQTGKTGWDGLFWKSQYRAFKKYFDEKGLAPCFGTLDSLTRSMGNVQLEHQGRRIEGMRMQDIGDAYIINGWESMPYDNHSGVVDIYRNPKGTLSAFTYYTQPLYVAVASRNQVVRLPGKTAVDFYIVNEKDVKGAHTLSVKMLAPDGREVYSRTADVSIMGGEKFGQLLLEGIEMPVDGGAGTYRILAELKDTGGKTVARGHDEVLAIDWQAADLAGQGAYYGNGGDKVAAFYKQATGHELAAFTPETGKLDWLVVNRSSLDEPTVMPASCFKDKNGRSTLKVSWFRDQDFNGLAATETSEDINRTFTEGAQPDDCLPANQPFSAKWEGDLYPTETGIYLIGVETNRGVRIHVNGEQLVDLYNNNKPAKSQRPIKLEAGKPAHIEVIYRQSGQGGYVKMKWATPSSTSIASHTILDRVSNDGTTLVLLGQAETWMEAVADYTGVKYDGYYAVGKDWIGGIHFVKEHPLFDGLPVNTAMNWPYQAVVRDGDQRFSFRIEGEDLAAGSYRSWPFNLGTAVGVIPCGKGKIIFSTLDIASNLDNPSGPAEVARKLLCNYIKYSQAK